MPLSAFLGGLDLEPKVGSGGRPSLPFVPQGHGDLDPPADEIEVVHEPEAPCLLVPDFLGCHLLGSIGEELLLDGGRLRVWSGAAMHNDQAAALLQAEARAKLKEKVGGIEGTADHVFSVAGASGHRLLGGPFLRAAAGDELLHVWLAPKVTAPTAAPVTVAHRSRPSPRRRLEPS